MLRIEVCNDFRMYSYEGLYLLPAEHIDDETTVFFPLGGQFAGDLLQTPIYRCGCSENPMLEGWGESFGLGDLRHYLIARGLTAVVCILAFALNTAV